MGIDNSPPRPRAEDAQKNHLVGTMPRFGRRLPTSRVDLSRRPVRVRIACRTPVHQPDSKREMAENCALAKERQNQLAIDRWCQGRPE
ncbi:hypothetical protein [Lysobacter gummosus]|uniref:hypothetical protein n=1 Tax=Lysobacter gummosus TaxID=262324 RepID=UPI00363EFDE5